MFLAASTQRWELAFWLLAAALVTDFFDGLAAKKLHAETVIGGHIDRVADFTLAFLGISALVFFAGLFPVGILWLGFGTGILIGIIKFTTDPASRICRVTSLFSLPLLFASWICTAWGMLTMSYGWSWLYPLVTTLTLIGAAALKRHRLASWFGWLAPNAGTRFGRRPKQ